MGIFLNLEDENVEVLDDFQIKVIKYDQSQVGETACLHTSFVEGNFARVTVAEGIDIDLIFTETKVEAGSDDSMGDEDFQPEITGQPSKKLKQKRIESKDMFWLSLVEQLSNKVAITNKEKKNQTSV